MGIEKDQIKVVMEEEEHLRHAAVTFHHDICGEGDAGGQSNHVFPRLLPPMAPFSVSYCTATKDRV